MVISLESCGTYYLYVNNIWLHLVSMSVDTSPDHTEGSLANDLVDLIDVIKEDLLIIRHIFRWFKPGSQLCCCSLGCLQTIAGLIILILLMINITSQSAVTQSVLFVLSQHSLHRTVSSYLVTTLTMMLVSRYQTCTVLSTSHSTHNKSQPTPTRSQLSYSPVFCVTFLQ